MLLILVTVSIANLFSAVVCVPLSDQGAHIAHRWGEVVRLRHLYAVRPGLHLLISGDGQIHGSAHQTPYSKSSILKNTANLLVNPTDDWRSRLSVGFVFHSDERLNRRPAGDPSSGSRMCCHQRSSNRTVSLHRRRWKAVLNGKDVM